MFNNAEAIAAQLLLDAEQEKRDAEQEKRDRKREEHERRKREEHARRAADLKASRADVWYLKPIRFHEGNGLEREVKIITQNFNGCVVCMP